MKNGRKFWTGTMFAIGVCLLLPGTYLAGDMNGNEQSVYNAASGNFDYNGQNYQASAEYLAQLQSYLCRDDIDMTADQAQAAIAQMNANVEQGVNSGYILPVGGGTPETGGSSGAETGGSSGTNNGTNAGGNAGQTSPDKKPDNNTDKDNGSEKKDDTGTDTKTDTTTSGNTSSAEANQSVTDISKSADGKSVVTSNGSVYGSLTEEQQNTLNERLGERALEEDANSNITYDKVTNTITVAMKDGKTYTLPKDLNAEIFAGKIFAVKAIGIVLLVLTIICGIFLIAFRCLKFQKKEKSIHAEKSITHNTRKRIRGITGIILSIVLAGDIFLGASILFVQVGYFDDGKIIDSLNDSAYYHEAYDTMMKDVHMLMNVSGCLENTCDNILTYENFMFATRNQIQLSLQGKESSATYDDIKDDVAEAVSYVSYFTEDSRKQLGAAVLTLYQTAVKNVIGDTVYALKTLFWEAMQPVIILIGISGALSMILLLFGERYKHRGTRRIANAFILSGGVGIILAAILYFNKPYTRVYIKPDYLYLFVSEFVSQSVQVLAVIAGIGVLFGVVLRLSARGMKKRIEQ